MLADKRLLNEFSAEDDVENLTRKIEFPHFINFSKKLLEEKCPKGFSFIVANRHYDAIDEYYRTEGTVFRIYAKNFLFTSILWTNDIFK